MLHRPLLVLAASTGRCFSSTPKAPRGGLALPLSYEIHIADAPLPVHRNAHPPVLVLHGLFDGKAAWRSTSKAIAAEVGVPVIPVDLRNHGRSPHDDLHTYEAMAADVEALCDKLSLAQVMVLGHSMGGKVAAHMALSRPHRIQKLVVADSPPSFVDLGTVFAEYMESMIQVEAANVSSVEEADAILAERTKDAPLRKYFLRNLKPQSSPLEPLRFQINLKSLHKAFSSDEMMGFPLRSTSSVFAGPALFLRALRANYISEKHFPDIKRLFPNSRIVEIESGHMIHNEKRQEFVALVSDFFLRS
ncbi:Alpha/Beta hydrolase protein [Zopfochytrium polystomum]|nr:Alpha/Beta hydrolase protein [Zopfochytrium polystomum]